MSKKRIFSRMLVSVLTVVSVLQIGAVATNAAGNYKDTAFEFDFCGEHKFTEFRDKEDNTSSYMKCNSCTSGTSYTAHVVGLDLYAAGIFDASRGHVYVFTEGTTCKLINYVYEDGYEYAAIEAAPNYLYEFSASGLWSPDSV